MTYRPKAQKAIKKQNRSKIRKTDHTCKKIVIIAPIGEALDLARSKAATYQSDRKVGKFMPIPLSADGEGPATHYGCAITMTPSEKTDYDGLIGGEGTKILECTGGKKPTDVFADEGLQRIRSVD